MDALRKHLESLLTGEDAHAGFESSVKDVPRDARGKKPAGIEHSLWEILEHLRIAQWDILEFSRDAKHVSPDFPSGYWPKSAAPPSDDAWEKSIADFRRDLKEFTDLVVNEKTDLLAKIPHGDGQTILREALVLADHNAYHVGQFVQLRKLLGAWGK